MEKDFLLVQRMKLGDKDAAETFVRKYYPMILRYCRLHVYDKNSAEDMTQATFERFFRAFPTYEHAGKAVNYLYVIAGNLCRDLGRKHVEMPARLPEQLPGQGEDGWQAQIEDRLDVEQTLKELPGDLREVVILRYLQDCKIKEIAQILGISHSLVKYRLKRGKEALQSLLEKERFV